MMRSVALLGVFAICFSSLSNAQSKADRKDEKRENERVNDAKQDLQKSQRELSAAVKAFRAESADVRRDEGALRLSQTKYSQAREAAEERLADSSGLPEAIRKMRAVRDEIETLSKPVLEQLHRTDKWKAASKQAKEAQLARASLLADDTRTDDEMTNQLAELEKQFAAPDALDATAIETDPKIKQLKVDFGKTLDAIAELRRKIDSSKIDADPEVKSLKGKVESSERDLAAQRKSLAGLNAKVANAQSALVAANRKLQQAQAADQKDSNKPKKK